MRFPGLFRSAAAVVPNGDELVVELFRRSALPATAVTLYELGSGDASALKIVPLDTADGLDPWTMLRALRLMTSEGCRPHGPILFDVSLEVLADLPAAQDSSDQALVAVVDARGLLDRPATTLRAVEQARSRGWDIGLRHVGAAAETLSAVLVLEPVTIALDPLPLVEPYTALALETVATIAGHLTRSVCVVSAEALQTPQDVISATALGAVVGRGPAVVPSGRTATVERTFASPARIAATMTPFSVATPRYAAHPTTAELVTALSRQLERAALGAGPATIVVASLRDPGRLTAEVGRRLVALSERVEMVLVATDGAARDLPGVTVQALAQDDPLVGEWAVVILGPVVAILLSAVPSGEGDFLYSLGYDRDLVAHAARTVLSRVEERAPAGAPPACDPD